jgi:hypothetical protein
MRIDLANLPAPVLEEVLKGSLEIDSTLYRALGEALTNELVRRSKEAALGVTSESIPFEVPFMPPGEALAHAKMMHETVAAMEAHVASIRDPLTRHAVQTSATFLAQIGLALSEQVKETSAALSRPAN